MFDSAQENLSDALSYSRDQSLRLDLAELMAINVLCDKAAAHDPTYSGERVAAYAMALADAAGVMGATRSAVYFGALLHDTGKLMLSRDLLNKREPLTPSDIDEIRRHPALGEDLCRSLGLPDEICRVVRDHHERWDGTGYGAGRAATEVSLATRIVSIADAFDAMVSDRPYRNALTVTEAMMRLREGAGSQWDPDLIARFIELIEGREIDVHQVAVLRRSRPATFELEAKDVSAG